MRLRLVATLVAATALATPADAAYGRDQVKDAKGDARGGLASLDILSARWSTSGRGASKALVATLTLAAAPEKDVPFVYEMHSEVGGCGTVSFQYAPGNLLSYAHLLGQPEVSDSPIVWSVWIECGGDGGTMTGSSLVHKQVTFTVKGNTLTWSVPFSALPPQIGPGTLYSDFSAVADAGEPTMGLSLLGRPGQSLDHARGDGAWRPR